jgi:hypothetical protein
LTEIVRRLGAILDSPTKITGSLTEVVALLE